MTGMCVWVCVYVHTHTQTHTHTLSLSLSLSLSHTHTHTHSNSLQIAVDKKRDELYPTMLAPRALRWWSAARAQTSETRRLASTDADQGPCPRAHGARAHGGATSARLSSS